MRTTIAAAIMLLMGASCSTVPQAEDLARYQKPDSPFHLVKAQPEASHSDTSQLEKRNVAKTPPELEQATPVAKVLAIGPPESSSPSSSSLSPTPAQAESAGQHALAFASEEQADSVETAAFEDEGVLPAPPAPAPAPEELPSTSTPAPASAPEPAPSQPAPSTPSGPSQSKEDPAVVALDEKAAPSVRLSLQEAIATALRANPTIPEADASIRWTKSIWNQVGLYPNPTLGYIASGITSTGNPGQHGVYVGQNWITADKLEWNRAIAAGTIGQAQGFARAQRLRVKTDTTIYFYRVLGAQRLVEIAKTIQNNARLGFEATVALRKAGQTSQADVLQAKAALSRADVRLKQAQRRLTGRWRQFAAMLGTPSMGRVTLVGDLKQEREEVPFKVRWQRLCQRSPELAAAKAHIARRRAKVGREEAQAIPNINTQNYFYKSATTGALVFGLQYTFAVPVIHQNEGKIASARASYVQACRNYDRVKLDLRNRLAQAVQQVEMAEAQAVTYREEVLPAATDSLELVRKGYEFGQYSVLRLLASQQRYASAASQYVKAQIRLRTSEAKVDGLLLTGGLTKPAIPVKLQNLNGLNSIARPVGGTL